MAAPGGVPFFDDLEPVRRVREDRLDYYVAEDSEPQRRPAVVFVHGGPIREDQEPGPRDWDGFIGYGTLAASHALVGVTFNHRLYSDMHYPQAAEDLAAVIERTRALEVVDPDLIALWALLWGRPARGRLDDPTCCVAARDRLDLPRTRPVSRLARRRATVQRRRRGR